MPRKTAWYTVMAIALLMFAASNALTIIAGVNPGISLSQNIVEALQVDYVLIPSGQISNPLLVVADVLNTFVFALLTAILAAWFYHLISSFNVRERVALSRIRKLKGHVIVIPFNGFAKTLLGELRHSGIKSVTITTERHRLPELYSIGELALFGSLKFTEAFETAQIRNAKFVVACSDDSMQNALIAITAKTANPSVNVISRVENEEAVPKLSVAGAYKVIMPELAAGESIGNEIAKRVS